MVQTLAGPHAESSLGLHGWPLRGLYAACLAVLLTVLCSYLPPAKHRFVDMLAPGAADLIPTINAAHALTTGVNPYHVTQLLVPDPYFYSRGEAEGVSYLYPPSHALLYVPLAWLAQWSFFDAIRAQYIIAVVCIALLTWLVVRVLRLVVDLDPLHGSLLLPVVGLVLALNPGNILGIERGQSDVMTSVFAWSAVLCFCRRRLASMAFFAMAASLLKGYGVLLAIGLLAIGALENWRRTVLGAAAALGCLLLPVYRYLPDAAHAYGIRSTMFWSGWTNQGFANLAFSLGIVRDGGRVALTAVAILSAATAWVCLLRSDRLRDERARSFGATAFATAALTSVVGYSLNSISCGDRGDARCACAHARAGPVFPKAARVAKSVGR